MFTGQKVKLCSLPGRLHPPVASAILHSGHVEGPFSSHSGNQPTAPGKLMVSPSNPLASVSPLFYSFPPNPIRFLFSLFSELLEWTDHLSGHLFGPFPCLKFAGWSVLPVRNCQSLFRSFSFGSFGYVFRQVQIKFG